MSNAIWGRATSFAKEERGTILVMAAAGTFAFAALAGLALDYGKVAVDRRDVQNGVDAAALAGAQRLLEGGSAGQVTAEGTTWLGKNGLTSGAYTSGVQFPPASGEYAGNSDCVEASTTHSVTGFLMPIGAKNVKARAVACQDHDWRKFAIVTLNTTACDAFLIISNVHFYIEKGGTFNNSECETNATRIQGYATLNTQENLIVGGWKIEGSAEVKPGFATAPHVEDPLGALPAPGSVSSPVRTCPTLSGSGGSVTLQPGRYNCTIGPSGGTWNVTFAAGNYEITGGIVGDASGDRFTMNGGTYTLGGQGLRISGSARVSASGATFYVNNGGCISLNGTSTLSMSAPNGGTYRGILFFQARGNACGIGINGNGAAGNTGTIYAPSARITYSGNVDSRLQFISDTFTANGGGCGTTTFYGDVLTDVRYVHLKE